MSKYEQSKNALERGYLNVKVIKVIKSCETVEQLEVAEKYIDLILLKMRGLFYDCVVANDESVQAYLYLKDYYQVLIKEVKHNTYKKGYKRLFRVDFEDTSVK